MMGDKLFCLKMNEFPQKPYHEWEVTNWIIKYYVKNYRLYIRSAGLLAMLLIFCIGLVVRDTRSSDVWRLIRTLQALVTIHPIAQEELYQQVQHLAACRFRFSFLAG